MGWRGFLFRALGYLCCKHSDIDSNTNFLEARLVCRRWVFLKPNSSLRHSLSICTSETEHWQYQRDRVKKKKKKNPQSCLLL